MFLSKNKQSGIYYVFYQDRNNKRKAVSSKSKHKREALAFLSSFQAELRRRQSEKILFVSLKDCSWEYLKFSERTHRPKTQVDIKRCLRAFQKFIGGKTDMHEITVADIERFLARKQKRSLYGAKNYRMYLNGFFKRALALEHILKNPIDQIPPIRTPEKVPTYFSRKEFNALLGVISEQPFKDIVLFAINSGMRLSEILHLQRDQINLEARTATLGNTHTLTKSGRARTLPLNDSALSAVRRAMERSEDETVFTLNGRRARPEYVSKRFKKYVRAAGLNDRLHFHSLRHSCASWLIQSGVSIYIVSKILGHCDVSTTQIYSHIDQNSLASAVNALSATEQGEEAA